MTAPTTTPSTVTVQDIEPLTRIVSRRASESPDTPFVIEAEGATLGYGEVDALALAWARGLASVGVRRDDVICSMRATTASGIATWLGAARLGAIDAGIAVTYRGQLLLDLLVKGRVLLIDRASLPALDGVRDRVGHLEAVVITGEDGDVPPDLVPGVRVLTEAELLSGGGAEQDEHLIDPQPWDIGCLTHTSGTTGPSKSVLLPWGHLYSFATSLFDPAELTEDECFYSPMPMNHVAQRVHTYLMAVVGGRVVVRNGFKPDTYWDDVRAHGCTLTNVSVGPKILWDRPAREDDADNTLTKVLMSPLLPNFREFGERFGVEVRTMFGSTEVGLPIVSGPYSPPYHRTSGRRNERFPFLEARLVDEHDIPVPVGTPGELVVRSRNPWTLNAGYLGQPETSFTAWRNGWFHTGDLLVEDEDGWFSFSDRSKDSIRRRGENISSFEVEAAIVAHPTVREAAVVGVESPEWGEQEVLAVVVPDGDVDPARLVADLTEGLPSFMVPRFVRIVDALPKSEATLRIQKSTLREQGVTDTTWDSRA